MSVSNDAAVFYTTVSYIALINNVAYQMTLIYYTYIFVRLLYEETVIEKIVFSTFQNAMRDVVQTSTKPGVAFGRLRIWSITWKTIWLRPWHVNRVGTG